MSFLQLFPNFIWKQLDLVLNCSLNFMVGYGTNFSV